MYEVKSRVNEQQSKGFQVSKYRKAQSEDVKGVNDMNKPKEPYDFITNDCMEEFREK